MLFSLFLVSCKKGNDENFIKEESIENEIISEKVDLKYISHNTKLTMIGVDDKCGEWGGDSDELILYRDTIDKKTLLADYIKINLTCKGLIKDSILIERIKVSKKAEKLIIESIKELSEFKIMRKNYPSHIGIYNHIMLSDSTLLIDDFPSKNWISFKKLVLELNLSSIKAK